MFSAITTHHPVTPPHAGPRPHGYGDDLEQRIVDGFGNGRENFVVPTNEQMGEFRKLVADARKAGDDALPRLREEAAPLGVQVDPLQVGDRRCLVLHEDVHGWGTVIVDPSSSSPLVVEVPHPGFDHGTPELGWRAFQAFDAGALVIAGSTRGNRAEKSPDAQQPHGGDGGYDPWKHAEGVPDYSISDPTHARQTMFQAAHQALTDDASCVLQLHGFSAWKHHNEDASFPADEQVVLTDAADDHYDPQHVTAAQKALESAGFRSHIVSFADNAHSQLGAVVNVQHQDMEERGLLGPSKAEFVHVELDTSLRRGPDRDAQYDRLLGALQPVFEI